MCVAYLCALKLLDRNDSRLKRSADLRLSDNRLHHLAFDVQQLFRGCAASQEKQAPWGTRPICLRSLSSDLVAYEYSAYACCACRRHCGVLQELNPIPYTGILGLTSGQVIYGSLIKNWFVFFANAPGLLIGLWLILSTLPHATPKVKS